VTKKTVPFGWRRIFDMKETVSSFFFFLKKFLLPLSREPDRRSLQTESVAGEVFRPRERIKSQTDFNRVGRLGRNFHGNHARVQWSSNETFGPEVTCTRLGIKTPKKHIKRAVDRNLVKRRVRDVFRKNKSVWPADADIVVYCSAATLAASYEELRREMVYWGKEVVPRVAERNDDRSVAGDDRKHRAPSGAKPERRAIGNGSASSVDGARKQSRAAPNRNAPTAFAEKNAAAAADE